MARALCRRGENRMGQKRESTVRVARAKKNSNSWVIKMVVEGREACEPGPVSGRDEKG